MFCNPISFIFVHESLYITKISTDYIYHTHPKTFCDPISFIFCTWITIYHKDQYWLFISHTHIYHNLFKLLHSPPRVLAGQKKKWNGLWLTVGVENPHCSYILSYAWLDLHVSYARHQNWLIDRRKIEAYCVHKNPFHALFAELSTACRATCSVSTKLLFKTTPLGAAKTSLYKQQVVCEMRVAKTCPCKANTFLLLQFKVEAIFRNSHNALAAVYIDILHLCGSKFRPLSEPEM